MCLTRSEKIQKIKEVYDRQNYTLALQQGKKFGFSRQEIDRVLKPIWRKGIGKNLFL